MPGVPASVPGALLVFPVSSLHKKIRIKTEPSLKTQSTGLLKHMALFTQVAYILKTIDHKHYTTIQISRRVQNSQINTRGKRVL